MDLSIGKKDGNVYCLMNKCYTYTQLAMLGLGALVMGVILGILGISWLKHQCYPTLYNDIPEESNDSKSQEDLVRDHDIENVNQKDNLEFSDERTEISDKKSQKTETDL